jgi:hypothetical protein
LETKISWHNRDKDLEKSMMSATPIIIVSVEFGVVSGQRFRSCGCNARLPIHGPTISDPMVRLITDTGLEGVGWASEGTTREEAEQILNKPLDELISVEQGATNRPFEMALWDLLGKHTHLPVYKLLAQAFGADGKLRCARRQLCWSSSSSFFCFG